LQFSVDESKKVALCRCKRTHNPPFCDGSHSMLTAEDLEADAAESEPGGGPRPNATGVSRTHGGENTLTRTTRGNPSEGFHSGVDHTN